MLKFYQLILIGYILSIYSSPSIAQSKNISNPIDKKSSVMSCDKKLQAGVSFLKTDEAGKKSKVRIRFAPFNLSAKQFNEFIKFRAKFEKTYGEVYGANVYQRLICRYFFGNYDYVNLPEDVSSLNKLLKECPLKNLKDVILAEGPRPDCAPGVVHCEQKNDTEPEHPLDKIACGRTTNL